MTIETRRTGLRHLLLGAMLLLIALVALAFCALPRYP